MTTPPIPGSELPVPQRWSRKHDFGGRDYVTLSVTYVAERHSPMGERLPERVRCVMCGTLLFPQEEFRAPNVDSGQMVLGAQFRRRFQEHQCNALCTGWAKTGGDKTPFDEGPITRTVQ